MKRAFLFNAVLVIAFLSSGIAGAQDSQTRSPAVAGGFYPADPAELSGLIDRMMAQVPEGNRAGKLVELVVPHAGYVYSGAVAAYGYKRLQNQKFDTVIMIGPSHHAAFNGVSVWQEGEWKTPLGTVPVDSELAKAIVSENPLLNIPKGPHLPEHSLEVQLPFLQKTLKDFKIVPVLIGNPTLENCEILAKAIAKHFASKRILILVSTDLSHYHPYEFASKMDRLGLDLVVEEDAAKFQESIEKGECEFCGGGGVVTAMQIAKILGNVKPEILRYANSGDVTGEKGKVVGYASIGFYENG